MSPSFFRKFLYFFIVVSVFSTFMYFSFPYEILTSQLQQNIKALILDANRLSIFIFGTTVTANVYLYNMKNKLSSSSHIYSDQILLLYVSVFTNLILILSSFAISSAGTTFNLIFSSELLLFWIKVHYSLFIVSLVIYFLTLIKFVNIFDINKNVKNHSSKIEKVFFIKNPFVLITSHRNILKSEVQSTIERHVTKIKSFDFMKYFNPFIISFLRHPIYNFFIYAWILALTFLSKKFTFENSFSDSKYQRLQVSIEIYAQQLEFLISQNSKESIDSYFEGWNNIISKLYSHLFHVKYPPDFYNRINEESNDALKLYKDTLSYHARLIISTSKNYEHSEVQNKLIESFLNALPYKTEASTIDFNIYNQNISFYKNTFFEELMKLIVDSTKQDKVTILHRILRMIEGDDENLFTKSKAMNIQGDYEDLWISVLLKIIELNKAEHISLICTLLIDANTEKRLKTIKNPSPIRFSKFKDEFTSSEISPEEYLRTEELTLSSTTTEGIYLAIIKANELEFYKVAGYLTKILASHLDFESILDVTKDIKENYSVGPGLQVKHKTNLMTLYYNNRSFQYCFAKSFVLFYCQYIFKDKLALSVFSYSHNFLSSMPKLLFNPDDFWYFLQKLENKQKEYNMISLIDANSDTIKSPALQSFYKNSQQLNLF